MEREGLQEREGPPTKGRVTQMGGCSRAGLFAPAGPL